MRTKRAKAKRHLPPLAAAGASILILSVTAAGCTGTVSGSAAASGGSAAGAAPAAGAAGSAAGSAPAFSAAVGSGSSAGSSSAGSSSAAGGGSAAAAAARLAAGGQQLIYTAQLTVHAANVAAAVSRATSVVTAAGGYVADEQATSGQGGTGSGGTRSGGTGQATATVTLKIPVTAYRTTLAALSGSGLGTRVSLSQQAQDVTQQVADTGSRVASDQAAIAQLRTLLKRAGSVSELLSVQNQINQQESDLESMLAQQRALSRETAYATVTLSLLGPAPAGPAAKAAPPPGLASGASSGWHAFTVTIGWLLTALGAIAPFAAALAVIAGLAWWVRRRRRERPAG